MFYSDNALAKFYLLNDISKNPALKMQEFLDLQNKFYNKNMAQLLDMPLWEIIEKSNKISLGEKVYLALKDKTSQESLKKLTEDSISILAYGDENYPVRLTQKLTADAPMLLYTVGDTSLLNKASVGVTGSRKANEKGKKFAVDIGEAIAKDNKVLISGGADGCDTIATESAINNGGKAVWFLAVPLAQMLKNKTIIKWIENGKICLCSDFNPYGQFSGNQALKRNTYIYSNCEAAVVCDCKSKISGTFSGAKKCLDKKLCRLYVYMNDSEAVEWLIKNGAIEITDN